MDLRHCLCGRAIELRLDANKLPGAAEFRNAGGAGKSFSDCPQCGRDLGQLLALGLLKPPREAA